MDFEGSEKMTLAYILIFAAFIVEVIEALVLWLLHKECKKEKIINVDANIYDKETIIENCTVQIWENSATGKCSIGWWKNDI